MKKTAILLDMGFVFLKLKAALGKRQPTAIEIRQFAMKCLEKDEEIFRIYCYDCPPYGEKQTHPLNKKTIDFSTTPTFTSRTKIISDLKIMDNIAFRSGELSFDGWIISKKATKDILKTNRAFIDDDFTPDIKQKGVDIKIGLDVAWLSSKSIIERIVLVTADSDFVPSMKFARREGVQVILVTMGHMLVKNKFKEHADELRTVTFP
ncbi:MAG: NYN domain-containing protein [Pyrinomonadaceae bacterium]